MPFDQSPQSDSPTTIRARLEILRDLLAAMRPRQQGSYRSCLWYEATHHQGLLAAGLRPHVAGDGFAPRDPRRAAAFFGLSPWIWSAAPKRKKRTYIDDVLARCPLPAHAVADEDVAAKVAVTLPLRRSYDEQLLADINVQVLDYLEALTRKCGRDRGELGPEGNITIERVLQFSRVFSDIAARSQRERPCPAVAR